MPEFDNDSDKLEQFFRKATNKPDVAFSEDDWSKLERRLDAAEAARALKVESPKKTIITAAIVGVLLLSSVGIWWGTERQIEQSQPNKKQANVSSPVTTQPQIETLQGDNDLAQAGDDKRPSATERITSLPQDNPFSQDNPLSIAKDATSSIGQEPTSSLERTTPPSRDESELTSDKDVFVDDKDAGTHGRPVDRKSRVADDRKDRQIIDQQQVVDKQQQVVDNKEVQPMIKSNARMESVTLVPLTDGKVRNELVVSASDLAERNKQRARIELPGAEEADQTGRQTMVEEEHASEKEHVAKPRLSLLLSFAPDFSGTSFNQYSPPGKAFGGMIRYHLWNRWSISAGVIKNYKQYTGAGEDYTPPTGYWKYYTNGIIPETIDGSCSILEFPIMVQYTVRDRGKNRWIVGAGASSYLMQTESYRYHFAQPNPGAKSGWDSRGSSRFMFNMLNLSVGYEHQVIPGLMIGLEPYVKLPLEEIGWSNLRLYSSGASLTLRYTLIGRKQILPVVIRSRGPD